MGRVADARAIATAMVLGGYHPEEVTWGRDIEILAGHTSDVVTGTLAYAFTLRDLAFETTAGDRRRAWWTLGSMYSDLINAYEEQALVGGHDVTGGLDVLKPR